MEKLCYLPAGELGCVSKEELYYTHFSFFLKELQHNGVENKDEVQSPVLSGQPPGSSLSRCN